MSRRLRHNSKSHSTHSSTPTKPDQQAAQAHSYGTRARRGGRLNLSIQSDTSGDSAGLSRSGLGHSPAGGNLTRAHSKHANKRLAQLRLSDDVDGNDGDDNQSQELDDSDNIDDGGDDDISQPDDTFIRYNNRSDQDDNDQASGFIDDDDDDSNDNGNDGDGDGNNDDDDKGEYDPDAHTAKDGLLYATAAVHTDADTPLVTGRYADDTQHSLYAIQQVHTMSKQQADVFTLHAVMKELILPGVKFIPNGDAGRALLKYTDDESSLCHKVITFTGRMAAGDNVAW